MSAALRIDPMTVSALDDEDPNLVDCLLELERLFAVAGGTTFRLTLARSDSTYRYTAGLASPGLTVAVRGHSSPIEALKAVRDRLIEAAE